jgi:dephospho-CoA kinase
MRRLESITRPPILNEIIRRSETSTAAVVVIDAVKLFESGLAVRCNATWLIACDAGVQVERLMARNRLDREEAVRRIAAQPPLAEKLKAATLVIDNSGAKEDTIAIVDEAWSQIFTLSKSE